MNAFGRYGIWVLGRHWPADSNEFASAAQEVESLGFGSVWIGGSPPDDLELAEALLAATSRLVVGTSIVDAHLNAGASHVAVQVISADPVPRLPATAGAGWPRS